MTKAVSFTILSLCIINQCNASRLADRSCELFSFENIHAPVMLGNQEAYRDFISDLRTSASEIERDCTADCILKSVIEFNPYVATNQWEEIDPCQFIQDRANLYKRALCSCADDRKLSKEQALALADKMGSLNPVYFNPALRDTGSKIVHRLNTGLSILHALWENAIEESIVKEAGILTEKDFIAYTNNVMTACKISEETYRRIRRRVDDCRKRVIKNNEMRKQPQKWHKLMPDGSLKEIDDEGLSPIR